MSMEVLTQSGDLCCIVFYFYKYVISNACSKELCFKQKGTDFIYRLVVGQQSHLHWADTTSFLPDHLGDAQVKMRKYAGALNMVRVEVQNANVSIGDEKIVGSSNGQSGTHLILLSDDNTRFMPYRIDNFSMERLRIYQQKCETFETTVHSYTSCPYAWDEPCYPHRLLVEVPGERVIGSYNLDDVRECIPVHLPQTSEKPERRLVLSVHAEGAIKVLSVVDSKYHILKDVKKAGFYGFKEKMKHDFKEAREFIERVTIYLSFIGISLINSSPQLLPISTSFSNPNSTPGRWNGAKGQPEAGTVCQRFSSKGEKPMEHGFIPARRGGWPEQRRIQEGQSKMRNQIFNPTYPRKSAWKRGLFSRYKSKVKEEAEEEGSEEDDEEGKECTICLEAFESNEKVLITPCNHMFHNDCLVPWVKSHGHCPVC